MTVTYHYGNRNVKNRLSTDRRWEEEFIDREVGVHAAESRKGPGNSDTDEWKALEIDQADNG